MLSLVVKKQTCRAFEMIDMFDGLQKYHANLQKAALMHPDPMMRIESRAELAFVRLLLMVLIFSVIYAVLGFLFEVF